MSHSAFLFFLSILEIISEFSLVCLLQFDDVPLHCRSESVKDHGLHRNRLRQPVLESSSIRLKMKRNAKNIIFAEYFVFLYQFGTL